jgi:hypothetical protein
MPFKLNVLYIFALSSVFITGTVAQACSAQRQPCGTGEPACCVGLFCSGGLNGIGVKPLLPSKFFLDLTFFIPRRANLALEGSHLAAPANLLAVLD